MCGIFGGFPKSKKSLNLAKLKVLGVANVSRGRDSCGYYFGGNVVKGVDKEKEFDDFIKANVITPGELYPIFLGHTRSASPGIYGGYSAINAHPFEFDDLVLTHNGVIYNIAQLVEKYKVDVKDINVDSHKLGKIISEKGLDVLHEYVGYAALAFVLKSEPEVGYFYHGKSHEILVGGKKTENCFEERPLHYMQTKEGVYYSSEKDPLMMIRESEEEVPKCLAYNKVFKIVNGTILTGEKDIFIVNREDNNTRIDEFKNKTYTTYNGYGGQQSTFFPKGGTKSTTNITKDFKDLTLAQRNDLLPERSILWDEALPKRARTKTNLCFYWKGRFWIKTDSIDNLILAEGLYHLSKKGEILSNSSYGARDYYFYKGMMIKSAAVYHNLLKEIEACVSNRAIGLKNNDMCNIAYYVAKDSVYPCTCLDTEGLRVFKSWRQRWFTEDNCSKMLSLTLSPKFSSRSYVIENSYIVNIKSSDRNDKQLFVTDKDSTVKDLVDDNEGEADEFPEKFHERKQMIRNCLNSIFDNKDFILITNPDALWVVSEMVKDLFKVDYNYDLTGDKDALEYNVEQFIVESINAGITIMENLPNTYDLEKYIDAFENHLLDMFDDAFNAKSPDNGLTVKDFETFSEIDSEKKTNVNFTDFKLLPMTTIESKLESNQKIISELEEQINEKVYLETIENKLSDVKDVSNQLNNLGDAFQSLDSKEEDDFVNEVANAIYRTNESLINEINLITEKYRVKVKKLTIN